MELLSEVICVTCNLSEGFPVEDCDGLERLQLELIEL